jgi:hypothetical protein
LGGDFDSLAEVFAGEEEVERGRGDNDFGVGVAGGFVEVGDDFFYALDVAVPNIMGMEWLVICVWNRAGGGWVYG